MHKMTGNWGKRKSERNETYESIDLGMTFCVMMFDVIEVGSVVEGRVLPIEQSQPSMEMGISGPNVPNIAFEVLNVDGIEADDGREKPDVGLGHSIAEQIRAGP